MSKLDPNIPIIAFSGRKRSGKDTSAARLVRSLGFGRVAMADLLKEFCINTFGLRPDAFSDELKEQPIRDEWIGYRQDGERLYVTPRQIAQWLGTEGARKTFGPDFWCAQLENQLVKFQTDLPDSLIHGYAITDVRFPNELHYWKSRGALIIRLNRADRSGQHNFTATAGHDLCQYLYEESGFPVRCNLPATSHPTSWTKDRHESEIILPDSGSIYDHAFICSSAEEAEMRSYTAVLDFLEKRKS